MFTGGCPFNQFGPCKKQECIFYLSFNNCDFFCALAATFFNAVAAKTYSFVTTNSIAGAPQSHESKTRLREDSLSLLHLLEEMQADPAIPGAYKAQMPMACDKMRRFVDSLGLDFQKTNASKRRKT